jgi:hypothetical protein
MSKTFLAEFFRQRLLVIFTALSSFFGGTWIKQCNSNCPEQPYDKGFVLYKCPQIAAKAISKA